MEVVADELEDCGGWERGIAIDICLGIVGAGPVVTTGWKVAVAGGRG